jgi:transposase InsO family protein
VGYSWLTNAVPAEDLVNREFAAAPNELCTAGITYVSTEEGFRYWRSSSMPPSRRLVGWAMEGHLRTGLVIGALEMALRRRRPAPGLIHHSNQVFSTRPSHSASGSKKPASYLRWGGSVALWTTPSRNLSWRR